MHKTISKWTTPRRLAAALGVLALTSGQVRADAMTTTADATPPMAVATTTTTDLPTVASATMPDPTLGKVVPTNLVYSTSGAVGSSGVNGLNVISFVPVSNSSVQTSTSLSLGTFVVAPLASGQTTVYNHTPFAISYASKSVDGLDISATQPLLTLTGFFNGQVSGSDQSNVVATFDPIDSGRLNLTDGLAGTLSLPSPQRTLVPSTTFSGQSTAEGFVDGPGPAWCRSPARSPFC